MDRGEERGVVRKGSVEEEAFGGEKWHDRVVAIAGSIRGQQPGVAWRGLTYWCCVSLLEGRPGCFWICAGCAAAQSPQIQRIPKILGIH